MATCVNLPVGSPPAGGSNGGGARYNVVCVVVVVRVLDDPIFGSKMALACVGGVEVPGKDSWAHLHPHHGL